MVNERDRKAAAIALKAAINAFLTAKSHLNTVEFLLDIEFNEDVEHELVSKAYEFQKVGDGKLTLEDLDYFIRKTTDYIPNDGQ
jgi:hypothetical protein